LRIETDTYTLTLGSAPLLLSFPHAATQIPLEIRARMHEYARVSADSDWHVDRLYAFACDMGVSMLVPKYSRYVIDLNRPANGGALYPGKNETGLIPTQDFSARPIYLTYAEPSADEIDARLQIYWHPYHAALAMELARLREQFGHVVLWDAHSIRSECSFFFEGRLPDLNLGTASGSSCAATLQTALVEKLSAQSDYSVAINGRFKGGYITRQYGNPALGVDAVQMEIAQRNYMTEDSSFTYNDDSAARLRLVLRELLKICLTKAVGEKKT
jgi:N-formylglutamate deformylase